MKNNFENYFHETNFDFQDLKVATLCDLKTS